MYVFFKDSQTNYTQCAKELCRLKSKFKQLEEETLQLKIEVESGVSLKENDKARIEELTKEVKKSFFRIITDLTILILTRPRLPLILCYKLLDLNLYN